MGAVLTTGWHELFRRAGRAQASRYKRKASISRRRDMAVLGGHNFVPCHDATSKTGKVRKIAGR